MKKLGSLAVAMTVAVGLSACSSEVGSEGTDKSDDWDIISSIELQEKGFTQGFEVIPEGFIVSSGGYGTSSLRVVDKTGVTLKESGMDSSEFAEGVTRVDDRYIQLTWKSGLINVWDLDLNPVTTLSVGGEGWGICYDGKSLWKTDGSTVLSELDPLSMEVVGSVEMTRDGKPFSHVNELECVNGKIMANVFMTNDIVELDPKTGVVSKTFDFTKLVEVAERDNGAKFDRDSVLNGIAYDSSTDTWFVTGKNWPKIYEVSFKS